MSSPNDIWLPTDITLSRLSFSAPLAPAVGYRDALQLAADQNCYNFYTNGGGVQPF